MLPQRQKTKIPLLQPLFRKWFHRETIPYRMQIRLNYFHANVEIIDWAPDVVASIARPKTLSELCREKFLTPSGAFIKWNSWPASCCPILTSIKSLPVARRLQVLEGAPDGLRAAALKMLDNPQKLSAKQILHALESIALHPRTKGSHGSKINTVLPGTEISDSTLEVLSKVRTHTSTDISAVALQNLALH
jgi:hypothetical protein